MRVIAWLRQLRAFDLRAFDLRAFDLRAFDLRAFDLRAFDPSARSLATDVLAFLAHSWSGHRTRMSRGAFGATRRNAELTT